MPILLSEAREIVGRRCLPAAPVESIALAQGLSRILAADVVAPLSVPPADNSAVDGYAFALADPLSDGALAFPVVGVSAAGRPFAGSLAPGQAVRIFTGAIPPDGCDAIVMQEDVHVDRGRVVVPAGVARHANIRRAGEDIREGALVLAAGRRLGPVELGVLASLGIARAAVRARLRVAVLSTGEELSEPGEFRRRGSIYDANRPTLLALLVRLGFSTTDLGIVPDSRVAIEAALAAAAEAHDAVISTAGVSVGDEDHVCAAVETLGRLDFSGVAIKPGRPVAFGQVGGAPFFGLPGNPVAMLIGFLMIARPGLLQLAGAEAREPLRIPVVADFALRKRPGRREFLRGALRLTKDGLSVGITGHGGSSILSSVCGGDGLVELAEEATDVARGAIVPFTPFAAFDL
jgi:molybdopterin molybdotransferase